MIIISILSVIIGFVLIYFFIIRPIQLRWGAINEEVKIVLPGDEIVRLADFNATRAITKCIRFVGSRIHTIVLVNWYWVYWRFLIF